ncbi:Stp1/IreP family PP2C-type Ser/Thr phosphatase [Streptococcus sp. sy004]|uniref:Stp1/IreP family PP2C-type Ser/Thr phosphatase n=1 Tax=Streptococcus sp. sy004 TaxID=2600149 RepID=UPI0011B481B7|nr:Stp1/IreP family PP2C-type Ser/Thr phosphatase [Streptococcus sp. sy004]TWT10362.1 Stp1/IreP family PP2C-type Ser/Thr phosphatase [Streptococcus sp. sy004]
MKLALLTDIGQKRSSNQDYVNKYDNKAGITLLLLADGMGGHRAGNIASEMTVTDLGRTWVNTDLTEVDKIRAWLSDVIEQENQKIYDLGQNEDYKGMGTTIEALAIVDQTIVYAHLGDSRISLVRQQNYTLLTNDHSLVNELVKAGQITPEEAANHPQKNIITQSIGQSKPVELEIGMQTLEPGDYLVVNSDGLTNMISEQNIVDVLAQEMDLQNKAKLLVSLANEAGGLDNITVALLHLESEEG